LLASRYVITFLVSLFGNSVIIHIVRKDNSMKTTTNYLIVNQACADILVTTMELLNDITYYFEDKWFEGIIGIITCKLLRASPFILSAFSVWILVAIAVDRYFAVTRPFQVSPLSRHFKKTVVFLWVWSAVSAADVLTLIRLRKEKTSDFCETVDNVYYGLVLNVVVPLIAIIILYTIICLKLWARKVPGDGANQNERQVQAIKTAKKVTRMMIAVVVLYELCWLPYFTIMSMSLIRGESPLKSDPHTGNIHLNFFIVWLTVAYSAINPFVYLTFNQKFRTGFKHLYKDCLTKPRGILPFRSQNVEKNVRCQLTTGGLLLRLQYFIFIWHGRDDGPNDLSYIILLTNHSMKTTTNYLILNQACADILTTTLQTFSYFLLSLGSKWFGGLWGDITCKLLKASVVILPNFSVWILVAIAVDRFYAVTRPFMTSPLSRHFKKTVIFLWVWSIASATYYILLAKLEVRTDGHYYCNLNTFPVEKKHADAWRAIGISELVLNVFLPLLPIIVLYSIVCLKLWSRDIPGEGTNQNERQAEALKIAKKVTRMMIAVVVLYLLCWLPFFVMFSRSILRYGYVNVNPNLLLFIVWLTIAYSGLNPYVYLTFSQKFRNVIIHVIRTDHSMKTTTNYLILNQACADILTTTLQTFSYFLLSLGSKWFGGLWGDITCRLLKASVVILPVFSVWILVAIAVDRFYAHADAWRAIGISELVLNFFLPLLPIIVLYSIVCLKLWSRDIPGEGTNQNERQAKALKIAKKVTRMMIAVVVILRYGYIKVNPSLLLFIVWLTIAYSGLNPY
ncbi:unnamed protein product, partial [Porites evermanni]